MRGIPGDSLTPGSIVRYVSAFAEYCRRHTARRSAAIVVGRDGRLGGSAIEDLAVSCLSMCGVKVIRIGMAPTPTVQLAAELSRSAGAISITASHNPQQWNGLKFLNSDGTFLDGGQISELISIAEAGKFEYADAVRTTEPVTDHSWSERHINEVLALKLLNRQAVRKRKFRAVVDAVNSSGSFVVPGLLERLGCRVTRLYCDGSGKFPHTPEPVPENLKSLAREVKRQKADLGISVDPDADRLVLITDEGKPFSEENTITAAARYVLKKNRGGTVTVNLSTTRAVEDVAAEFGGRVMRSAVGEINVVKEMKSNGSVIGGEGSGGVILPESHYGRDSLVGLALILSELAESGLTVSGYKRALPQYSIAKAKISGVKNPDKALAAVKRMFEKDPELIKVWTNDGLKLDFRRHWIHLRKSNTEPIIRIITEAGSMKEAERIQSELIKKVGALL